MFRESIYGCKDTMTNSDNLEPNLVYFWIIGNMSGACDCLCDNLKDWTEQEINTDTLTSQSQIEFQSGHRSLYTTR